MAGRIAVDVTPLQNAHRVRGIGTYVSGLARRLSAQSEVPIEFWGWRGELSLDVKPPHEFLGLPRPPMPDYRAAWVFARLALAAHAKLSRARAVHVTDPNALMRLRGRRLATTAYDLIPLADGIERLGLLDRAGYRLYLNGLKQADLFFAISATTADELETRLNIPKQAIVLAAPGVDTFDIPIFNPPTAPFFLFVGGPNPNKNLDLLLAARTRFSGPHEVLIVGHWLPQHLSDLRHRVESLGLTGVVKHLGFVDEQDLIGLMRTATAVVVPSLSEGFGLPVAEAMAAGAVVIHSDIRVLSDTSQGAALTFKSGSADELAACLGRAARRGGEMESLRGRALDRARHLTWQPAIEATLDAYRRLVDFS